MFADHEFKKALACGTQGVGCVEVAVGSDVVAVRDSKNLDVSPLVFSRDEWECFLDGVKRKEFDL